jgi:hypothetical protein
MCEASAYSFRLSSAPVASGVSDDPSRLGSRVWRARVLVLLATVSMAAPAWAVDPGKAIGTATIDASTKMLAFAVETRKENLFDEKKQDIVVVLTDKPLGTTKPDDEVELSLRARRGDLLVFALRIDGNTLINVTVSHKGLNGLVILPGPWFQYTATRPGTGTLKLVKREYEGHSYAATVDFAAIPYRPPRRTTTPPAPVPKTIALAPRPASAPGTMWAADQIVRAAAR